ncbi:hypothetical protein POUND7_002185, partial [Theobroma cacao]
MERSDSRLLDMKSFSLSPNSTMERSDSLLTGASSRSCKYVLTTLMQKILKFYESDTMERLRISFGMKFYVCCKSIYKMMSKFYETEQNFRPLIAMEKAVDFLWNEEALLLLAK